MDAKPPPTVSDCVATILLDVMCIYMDVSRRVSRHVSGSSITRLL